MYCYPPPQPPRNSLINRYIHAFFVGERVRAIFNKYVNFFIEFIHSICFTCFFATYIFPSSIPLRLNSSFRYAKCLSTYRITYNVWYFAYRIQNPIPDTRHSPLQAITVVGREKFYLRLPVLCRWIGKMARLFDEYLNYK